MRFFCWVLLSGCAGAVTAQANKPFQSVEVTHDQVIFSAFNEGVATPDSLYQQAEQQARDDFSQFIVGALQHLDMQLQAADQESLKATEQAAVIENASRVSMGRAEHSSNKVERQGTEATHVIVRYRVSRSALESAFAKGIAPRKSAAAVVGATFDGLRPASPAAGPPTETTR